MGGDASVRFRLARAFVFVFADTFELEVLWFKVLEFLVFEFEFASREAIMHEPHKTNSNPRRRKTA